MGLDGQDWADRPLLQHPQPATPGPRTPGSPIALLAGWGSLGPLLLPGGHLPGSLQALLT